MGYICMRRELRRQARISHSVYLTGDMTDVCGCLDGLCGHLDGNVTGDLSGIYGCLNGVIGDFTGIFGDLTDVVGDIADCDISDAERAEGVDIEDLVR